MNEHNQSENSIAEILDGKRRRREALQQAILSASPEDLEEAGQSLKKVLRESKGKERRKRINPPQFTVERD